MKYLVSLFLITILFSCRNKEHDALIRQTGSNIKMQMSIDSLDHATLDLYNEFDESYNLLNSISDESLSERLLRAKQIINTSIKSITDR